MGYREKTNVGRWTSNKRPVLANIALGGKILWKLYSNNSHPVSQLLRKKYLKGASMRNLQIDSVPKVTLLWNLCRKGFEFFQKQLNRVPENVKTTLIWTNKIMGMLQLESTHMD